MIADGRSKLLSKASASDTKQLWQLLRNTGNWSNRASNNNVDCSGLALKADDLNAYFAQVATDPHYSQNELENLCCSFSRDSDFASFSPFSDELFITVLGRVRSTSPGPEGIPFWLYKLCAVELGPVVAKLVNISFARQKVPRT